MIDLVLGLIGMMFILSAFILDEFYRQFRQDSVQYNVLNIIGSGFLLYYAYLLKGWPFFILNLLWLITALAKLIKILNKKSYGKR